MNRGYFPIHVTATGPSEQVLYSSPILRELNFSFSKSLSLYPFTVSRKSVGCGGMQDAARPAVATGRNSYDLCVRAKTKGPRLVLGRMTLRSWRRAHLSAVDRRRSRSLGSCPRSLFWKGKDVSGSAKLPLPKCYRVVYATTTTGQ